MANPFDDLRRRREQKLESKVAQAAEASQREKATLAAQATARQKIVTTWGKAVTQILTQARDALYKGSYIRVSASDTDNDESMRLMLTPMQVEKSCSRNPI
jgi:polyphosphate kinase 2 (PPK2 family)